MFLRVHVLDIGCAFRRRQIFELEHARVKVAVELLTELPIARVRIGVCNRKPCRVLGLDCILVALEQSNDALVAEVG